MAHIESTLSPGSQAYRANREHMLALIDRVREYERRTLAKSAASSGRFEKRQQLLPRERLSLLLDPGAPFLELCSLAGLGLDTPDLDKSVPGGVPSIRISIPTLSDTPARIGSGGPSTRSRSLSRGAGP